MPQPFRVIRVIRVLRVAALGSKQTFAALGVDDCYADKAEIAMHIERSLLPLTWQSRCCGAAAKAAVRCGYQNLVQ